MNLAWKLAGVLNGDLPETVLATYQGERKPHTRLMIGLALGMGWAMTVGGRLGNAIRRIVAPRLHAIPWLRSMITNSLTPPLRRSALVIKSRRPRQLAGTLCPNPVLGEQGQKRHLDILLGNGFGLVTTEPLDATQREKLRLRATVAIRAAPGGELARWLRRGGVTTAVIRPDRTVMRAGRRLATLCDEVPPFRSASPVVSRPNG
jgi:3-(3-hydroxy-phenyl)propionate hydroxylase